jgi:hypothetical protein
LIGRPTALLQINPGAGGIIGVEFGVDFVAVILTDLSVQLLGASTRRQTRQKLKMRTIDQTLNIVDEAIALAKSNGYACLV